MRSTDRVSSLLFLALCGYFWYASAGFNKLGRLFPRTIVLILGALALVLLISSFIHPEDEEPEKKAFGPISTSYWEVGGAAGLFLAWAFFLHIVGFAVTSFLVFSVIAVLFEKREKPFSYYLIKVVSIAVTIAVFYYFFDRLLRVPFPRGLLF